MPAAILAMTLGAGVCWALPLPVFEDIVWALTVVGNALSPAPAYAEDEAQEKLAEQLKEQLEKQAEQLREQQKQQAEQQRELQKQQAERQREQQKLQTERESEDRAQEVNASRTEGKSETESSNRENSRETDQGGDGEDRSSGGNYDEDDGPPRTLAEAWQRLTQGGKKKSAGGIPPDVAATTAHSMKGPTFAPREIVATNLGKPARDRVKALGFQFASKADLANLGMRVDRLILPKGMDVATARHLLKSEIPAGGFSPNHLYRIYRSAEGDKRSPIPETAAPASGVPMKSCEGDHCFGRSLIRWNQNLRTCVRKVRVGVIDTSFDLAHPALAGHRFSSGVFLAEGSTADHDWHGTAVLSILAGDSRSSTPGLIPDAEFYLASAFRTDENGDTATDTVNLLNALAWLDALDVRLVNMSFSGPPDELLETALAQMHAKGVVFVAAAGNDGPAAPPSYPAAYPSVIAVTAVSKSLQGYRYANRGSYVDLAAPGVDIWTALPNGMQGYKSGTSFAAPFVTSIIAAMQKTEPLPSDKSEILKRLAFKDLGKPGRDPIYGEGLPLSPGSCGASPSIATHPAPPPFAPQMSVGAAAASADPGAAFSWAPTGGQN